jgi:hypothetical protein
VADIGHAAADEDFINLAACYVGEGFGIIRIIGIADDMVFESFHR